MHIQMQPSTFSNSVIGWLHNFLGVSTHIFNQYDCWHIWIWVPPPPWSIINKLIYAIIIWILLINIHMKYNGYNFSLKKMSYKLNAFWMPFNIIFKISRCRAQVHKRSNKFSDFNIYLNFFFIFTNFH